MTTRPRLLLCGNLGGTNIADSFSHVGPEFGWELRVLETNRAFEAGQVARTLSWRLLDHRPPRLGRYNRTLRFELDRFRPQLLLTLGVCPVTADTLMLARRLEAQTANYSTDDPWSPAHRARRFHRSIPYYDHVFTPRRANVDDFTRAAARAVHYLPFAYDPRFSFREATTINGERADIIFVGGGDRDRIPLLRELVHAGFRLRIHGSYWGRDPVTRSACAGQVGPRELRTATCGADVNLILVRRANRDGHVMRSFEAAACGGCLLVEDTAEHREIFADTVTYFSTTGEMIEQARRLLADPERRRRSAEASHRRIAVEGRNTYADRLQTILETVSTR
ncbi:MAG TPA: glycosyltransferase [Pirellulales bacterium]|nr:glycosyltransferase [Pirellulales bacterium]